MSYNNGYVKVAYGNRSDFRVSVRLSTSRCECCARLSQGGVEWGLINIQIAWEEKNNLSQPP